MLIIKFYGLSKILRVDLSLLTKHARLAKVKKSICLSILYSSHRHKNYGLPKTNGTPIEIGM